MNKIALSKNLSMLMTGIIYVGMGFAAGFAAAQFFVEDAVPPAEAVSVVETVPPTVYTPTPVITVEPEYYGVRYVVKAVKDELQLCELDGETEKVLRKSKINMNSFPITDEEELRKGINTGTLEGALEIWEGFVE